MLQEIKIKNFKSFKEEAELSFEAYSDDTNQLSWINWVKNLFRNYKMKAYTYIRQGEFGFTEKEKPVTEKKASKGFFGRKKKENAEENPVEK